GQSTSPGSRTFHLSWIASLKFLNAQSSKNLKEQLFLSPSPECKVDSAPKGPGACEDLDRAQCKWTPIRGTGTVLGGFPGVRMPTGEPTEGGLEGNTGAGVIALPVHLLKIRGVAAQLDEEAVYRVVGRLGGTGVCVIEEKEKGVRMGVPQVSTMHRERALITQWTALLPMSARRGREGLLEAEDATVQPNMEERIRKPIARIILKAT
ncbi:hypothetical protein CYMTET_8809, partial [Cymbomonas tetramitiformis]